MVFYCFFICLFLWFSVVFYGVLFVFLWCFCGVSVGFYGFSVVFLEQHEPLFCCVMFFVVGCSCLLCLRVWLLYGFVLRVALSAVFEVVFQGTVCCLLCCCFCFVRVCGFRLLLLACFDVCDVFKMVLLKQKTP